MVVVWQTWTSLPVDLPRPDTSWAVRMLPWGTLYPPTEILVQYEGGPEVIRELAPARFVG